MKNYLKAALALMTGISLASCSNQTADTPSNEPIDVTGTYSIQVTGYDWGPGVNKAVIAFNTEIASVDSGTFAVTETKSATDWTDASFPVVESDFVRTVEAAYLSDQNGNQVSDASSYVTLELYVSPSEGSPINYNAHTMFNTWCDPYELKITLADGAVLNTLSGTADSVTIETAYTAMTTNADAFEKKSYTASDGTEYGYGLYTADSDVLFVWLHGFGEGGAGLVEGTDPTVTALGNRVTAFIQDEFQNALGGANVLVPQSPTYWNDPDGTHDYTDSNSVLAKSAEFNGASYYTETLDELIQKVKEDTGSEKVVIAGCSSGGLMTMNMALTFGDKYEAYIPIAEGIASESITDGQIADLAKLNMYFIYSMDDNAADVTLYSDAIVNRILEAGAENVKRFASEHVIDTSGKYKDENGNPYQYAGHWSWIYFDNNEADADDGSGDVFSWIAQQVN